MPAIDVQLLFPHIVALLVVGLHGRAEIVGHDGETAAVGNKLGGRHERVLLEEPGYHLAFFRPFVQWHVAVPNEMRGRSCECLADAVAEGVIGEQHILAVGAHHAGEHAVALPIVTPARAEGAETDAKLGFESLLIDRGDNATAQRHFLELLEHEVALAVVVVEMFAVFGQPTTGIVAAVVAFARLEEVAHAVGHAVEAFHLAAAFVLGRDEVVELVVVVPSHAARNLVARHQQAVAHVPRVAAAELLHVARTYALERLAPEPVAPGGDVHAARKVTLGFQPHTVAQPLGCPLAVCPFLPMSPHYNL